MIEDYYRKFIWKMALIATICVYNVKYLIYLERDCL